MTDGDFALRAKEYSKQEAFMQVAEIDGKSVYEFWAEADSIVERHRRLKG